MTVRDPVQRAILAKYRDGPALLEAAVAGLTEGNLNLCRTPESWTIRQIVHHIVDGDDLWKTCLKAALGNGDAVFSLEWYWERSQDEWQMIWNYAERPIAPSLALFRANREHVLGLIERIPDAWSRSIWVQWPQSDAERVTVADVLEMQGNHAAEHIRGIGLIRKIHGLALSAS